MKADFSRLQFNLDKHYTRILQQQGRVTLDSDWNEQVTLQADLDRKRLQDMIGLCGVPHGNPGFFIDLDVGDLTISSGVIYVHGLRIQLESPVKYSGNPRQPFLPDPTPLTDPGGSERVDLVYICVTERHITYLEEDAIREVALGGPDTTTRVQTVWQVQVQEGVGLDRCEEDFSAHMPSALGGGLLSTDTITPSVDEDPCVTPTGSGYRGLENRLYRVEVHQDGTINGTASIKWSRYNGAVAFNLVPDSINETTRTLQLTRLGWDQIRTLKKNDWIELVSEADELSGEPGAIVQIDSGDGAVDEARRQITLKNESATTTALATYKSQTKVKIRLWNGETEGEIKLVDHLNTPTRTDPIDLEDGIQILLSVNSGTDQFRSGDYWTFKARTIADVDGKTLDELTDQPPHGPQRHCCKLALIHWNDPSRGTFTEDCRPVFPPLTQLLNLYYVSGDGQEAKPGNELPQPLIVRVNHGEYPVANVPINFDLQTPGDGAALLDATAGSPISNPVYTDSNGIAQVWWRLGNNRAQPSQQVRAYINAPGNARQHLQVRFNANLSLAEEVSYKPPTDCPNLTGTTTVAEALNALCTITADQVVYSPPDNCPNLEGATNVAEALNALCHVGGGCSLSVGPGGDFEDLDTALSALLGRGVLEICLCLMAGQHKLRGFTYDHDLQKGELHIRISGCGPNTVIDLQQPLSLTGVTSLHLDEVSIQTSFPAKWPISALEFDGFDELSLTGCNISGITDFDVIDDVRVGGTLVSISNTVSVRLRDLRMEVYTPATFDILLERLQQVNADIIREAITTGMQGGQPFLEAALAAGRKIIAANPDELSDQMEKLNSMRGVWSDSEQNNFRKLGRAVTHRQRPSQDPAIIVRDYAGILIDIRRAAIKRHPGCALVLNPWPDIESPDEVLMSGLDRDSFISIESCEVAGEVGLYGWPITSDEFSEILPEPALKQLQADIKESNVPPIPNRVFSLGTLEIRGNQISRLSVANRVVQTFANRFDIGGRLSLYNEMLLTDNIFENALVIIAAFHCGLSGNQFLSQHNQMAGIVFGDSGVYSGNRGIGQSLRDITWRSGEGANVLISID